MGMFKKTLRFPLNIMLICVVSTQILSKIYKLCLQECDTYIIKQYSDKNSENFYQIIIWHFHANFQCLRAGIPILLFVFLSLHLTKLKPKQNKCCICSFRNGSFWDNCDNWVISIHSHEYFDVYNEYVLTDWRFLLSVMQLLIPQCSPLYRYNRQLSSLNAPWGHPYICGCHFMLHCSLASF